ncbi:MAG: HAD-IIIC family phosphatase [Prevotella sp.]|jgi:FkbH-like protein|nr:HAD-IIIC family phosphatase [Prevotella sp.]
MKYFIFRNYTIEPFFKGIDASFSGYEDVSSIDASADRYIWFYCFPYKTNNEIIAKEIRHYSSLLEIMLSRADTTKQFIIFTMASLFKINYQITDTNIEEAVIEYNQKLHVFERNMVNIKIIDINNFYFRFSEDQLIDWKFYYLSQIPVNPKLIPEFSQWFKRQLEIIELKRKKCIVVDLDNTLWAGVLGEDGAEGIKMDEDYPGSAFRFFQAYLLELAREGIILTVCSKNNESDVLMVWEQHPDMLLRKEQFVAYRINWNNKADNIKDIATELNIGLDSVVFIDDNPSERELVKQMLPEVSVPEFPAHPYLYPAFVKQLTDNYFSSYRLTQEDLLKTQQYKENAERVQYRNQFTDLKSYLRSLEIELNIEKLNEFNITRFSQMTQKTNQFNLTTRRYTETEIQNMSDAGALAYGLRVKDKFGDNGLTGLIIIKADENSACAHIDTFLLSCRILGKDIECALLTYMLIKMKNAGIKQVFAEYNKTSKNTQVMKFYDGYGFEIKECLPDHKYYELILDKADLALSDIYKVEEI